MILILVDWMRIALAKQKRKLDYESSGTSGTSFSPGLRVLAAAHGAGAFYFLLQTAMLARKLHVPIIQTWTFYTAIALAVLAVIIFVLALRRPKIREVRMNAERRRTLIPIQGGSAQIPTGAMQFEGDWPGLFIRGDDAIFLAHSIRQLEKQLAGNDDVEIAGALHRLSRIAEVIERDVKTGTGESGTS